MSDKNQSWRSQPSPTRPYRSYYGAGFVSAPQFLAEGMCGRMARFKQVDLPSRFWNHPQWKRMFLTQVRFATALLKVYEIKAIVAALKRCPKAFSLGAKWLDPFFQTEQTKLNQQKAVATGTKQQEPVPAPAPPTTIPRREAFAAKPTLRNLLEKYDE